MGLYSRAFRDVATLHRRPFDIALAALLFFLAIVGVIRCGFFFLYRSFCFARGAERWGCAVAPFVMWPHYIEGPLILL